MGVAAASRLDVFGAEVSITAFFGRAISIFLTGFWKITWGNLAFFGGPTGLTLRAIVSCGAVDTLFAGL
jgi:hypothetical protein